MCSEIQDGGKVRRANRGRAVLEKATPENTKKVTAYGVYNKTIIPLPLVVMS